MYTTHKQQQQQNEHSDFCLVRSFAAYHSPFNIYNGKMETMKIYLYTLHIRVEKKTDLLPNH